MPYIVGGKEFYQANSPSKIPFEYVELPAVRAVGAGPSEGSAIHNAEQNLADAAGAADGVIVTWIHLSNRTLERGRQYTCNMRGTPINRVKPTPA